MLKISSHTLDRLSVRKVMVRWLSACAILSASAASFAQSDAAAVSVGEGSLVPTVRLGVVTNDNVFASTTQIEQAGGFRIQPSIKYVADIRQNSVSAEYVGDYLETDEDAQNYTDHAVGLSGRAFFSSRSRLSADLSIGTGHYNLGGNLSSGVGELLTEPYRFRRVRSNVRYRYGADGARGNLTFGLATRSRSFLNEPNPQSPDRTSGLSFTRLTPSFIASFRVGSNTRALFDFRFAISDYEPFAAGSGIAQLDNDALLAGLGLSWNLSGRTTGRFIARSRTTRFKDNSRETDSDIELELGAVYQFSSLSILDLGLRREVDDVASTAGLVTSDIIELTWTRSWSSRLSTLLVASWETESDVCSNSGGENEHLSISADVTLQVRRWIALGARISEEDSSIALCDTEDPGTDTAGEFNRTMGGVYIQLSL